MRRIVGSAIVAFQLLAGCSGPPASEAGAQTVIPGESALEGSGPPSITWPEVRGLLNETVKLQNCEGAFGSGDLPADRVRSSVPPAFKVAGFTPETAGIAVLVFECAKVSAGGTVYEKVRLLQTSVLVEPTNQSWESEGLDWFVFETFVDGIDVPGIPDRPGTFDVQNLPAAQSWRIRNGSSSYDVELYKSADLGIQRSAAVAAFWFGYENLTRLSSRSEYRFDLLHPAPSSFRSSGGGPTHAAFGDAAWIVVGSGTYQFEWRLRIEDQVWS